MLSMMEKDLCMFYGRNELGFYREITPPYTYTILKRRLYYILRSQKIISSLVLSYFSCISKYFITSIYYIAILNISGR